MSAGNIRQYSVNIPVGVVVVEMFCVIVEGCRGLCIVGGGGGGGADPGEGPRGPPVRE